MTYYMWGIVGSKTIIQAKIPLKVVIEVKAGVINMLWNTDFGIQPQWSGFVRTPVWFLVRGIATNFLLA